MSVSVIASERECGRELVRGRGRGRECDRECYRDRDREVKIRIKFLLKAAKAVTNTRRCKSNPDD